MKPVSSLVAVLVAAAAFSVYAYPLQTNGLRSSSRFFSLDGKWYSVGEKAGAASLIREELRKRGFDIRRIPRKPFNADEPVLDILTEISPRMRPRPPGLASGLRVEKAMGIEAGPGFLDITSGNISPKGAYARKVLAAEGWTLIGTEDSSMPACIGTIRNGRETSIVFLDEKEGEFLHLRQREK